MRDIIRGPVTNVVDGDTFDISVTHVGTNNVHKYNDVERIRIVSIDAPELNKPGGKHSKNSLETLLLHREVRCSIHSRDSFGRIVADFSFV